MSTNGSASHNALALADKLACSKQVLDNKQVLVHSKVLVLVHSKVLVLDSRELEQVHSKRVLELGSKSRREHSSLCEDAERFGEAVGSKSVQGCIPAGTQVGSNRSFCHQVG